MITMPLKPLKQGQVYKIVYQITDVQRKPRVAIMRYIGVNFNSTTGNNELYFDLRPVAGTQQLNEEWILAIRPVDEPLMAPEIWKRS